LYYIIDGYNLFFQITEDDPTEANKEAFVLSIATLMKKANLKGEMIFDTPIHHETLYAHSLEKPPLTILLAPTNLEADDLIVEKIYASSNLKKTIVVSSDKALAYRVKEVDGQVMSVNKFMNFLRKKNRDKPSDPKPPASSSKDIERYEEIFLKKLEDESE